MLRPDARPFVVIGTGRLREAVQARLAGSLETDRHPRAHGGIVVAVTDGSAFLPVWVEPGRALIGPAVLPGEAGCLDCAARRLAAADADRAVLRQQNAQRLADPSTGLTAFAVHAVAAIAAGEAATLLAGERPRSLRALIGVDLARLITDTHPFLPDPLCPSCGDLPRDGAAAATVTLASRPKISPTSLRAADLAGRAEQIRRSYVDSLVGVVSGLTDADACGLPVSFAPSGWPGHERKEIGIGRATDRTTSGLAAVLEVVEHRAGTAPTGRRTVERASFTEVAARAIDPRTLGLLLNLLYLLLTRLGVRPVDRYLLAHLAANATEEQYAVDAIASLRASAGTPP